MSKQRTSFSPYLLLVGVGWVLFIIGLILIGSSMGSVLDTVFSNEGNLYFLGLVSSSVYIAGLGCISVIAGALSILAGRVSG